jgi:hypothetical protein
MGAGENDGSADTPQECRCQCEIYGAAQVGAANLAEIGQGDTHNKRGFNALTQSDNAGLDHGRLKLILRIRLCFQVLKKNTVASGQRQRNLRLNAT